MINLPAQLASANQSLVFGCSLIPSGGGGAGGQGAEGTVEQRVWATLAPLQVREKEVPSSSPPPLWPPPSALSFSLSFPCPLLHPHFCLSPWLLSLSVTTKENLGVQLHLFYRWENLGPGREAGTGSEN